jgi:hypothetical protein
MARTLVDVAALLPLDALAEACRHAWEPDRRREREAHGEVLPDLMLVELRAPLAHTP